MSIAAFAFSASVSTADFAAAFSSEVKPACPSIADFFASAAAVISCLAASLDVAVVGTFSIACLPAAFALSTPA